MISIWQKLRLLISDTSAKFQTHAPQPPPTRASNEKLPDPKSSEEAHFRLKKILHPAQPIDQISRDNFILGWVAMAYIAPGLNPDEAADEDGGWPITWKPIAAEAFRRHQLNQLTDQELYPKPY